MNSQRSHLLLTNLVLFRVLVTSSCLPNKLFHSKYLTAKTHEVKSQSVLFNVILISTEIK